MDITIFSTMSGKQWKGEVEPQWIIAPDAEGEMERIFRLFNRVEQEDCDRLEGIGYDLPSLSSGDFVQDYNGQWWLCASVGWQKVTARQAILPQMDYKIAQETAHTRGEYAAEVRPPMFLKVDENGALSYMRHDGTTRTVEA